VRRRLQDRAGAVLLAVLLAACSPKPELRPFTPPGQAFIVQMPGPTRHEQRTAETPAGTATSHVDVAEFDGVVYAVNYLPLPDAASEAMPEMGTPEALAYGRAALLETTPGATVVRESYVSAPLGTRLVAGSNFELELPGGATMTVRQFVHEGVFLQVVATVPVRPSYNQELYAQRFLDSFSLK
jgi:hypothetical protein